MRRPDGRHWSQLARTSRLALRSQWRTTALAGLALASGTLLQLAFPVLLREIVLWMTSHPVRHDGTAPGYRELVVLGVAAIATLITSGVLQHVGARLGERASGAAILWLRERTHESVLTMPWLEFQRLTSGELHTRILAETEQLRLFWARGVPFLLVYLMLTVGAGIVLGATTPYLLAVAALPLPLLFLTSLRGRRAVAGLYHEASRRASALAAVVGDSLRGMATLRVFGMEAQQMRRFHDHAEPVREVQLETLSTVSRYQLTYTTSGSVATVLVWLTGAVMVAESIRTSAADIVTAAALVGMIYHPLARLGETTDWAIRAAVAATRIAELGSRTVASPAAQTPLAPGELAFESVGFSFDPSGSTALTGVSFRVRPGEVVALAGRSGSGKSTVLALAARLLTPSSGRISLGERDVWDIEPDMWRSSVGVVLQQTFLFRGSVNDNIRFGRSWIDDSALVAAARLARAHDFVIAMPDGYETIVGDGGRQLSGGERLRIGLARALAGDPAVLLLDEPTAALDDATAREFAESLRLTAVGRSTLLTAHRPSILASVDRVVVIDRGAVIEEGPFEALIAHGNGGLRAVVQQTPTRHETVEREAVRSRG